MKAGRIAFLAGALLSGALGIGKASPAPSLAAQHASGSHQSSDRYAVLMGNQAILSAMRADWSAHVNGDAPPGSWHRLNQRQIRLRRRRAQKWPAARKRQ